MSAGDSALLRCADVHKSFGGVPVLKGITLDLQPGTVTALAGENGAGKSTLMKIISGQYTADRGDGRGRRHRLWLRATPRTPSSTAWRSCRRNWRRSRT